MSRPFAIGLCTSEHPLHPHLSLEHPRHHHHLHHHQPIPDTVPSHLFIAHVDYATTATSLSAAFDIPPHLAASEWLFHSHRPSAAGADVSSSSGPCRSSSKANSSTVVVRKPRSGSAMMSSDMTSSYRFTPRSVIDAHLFSINNSNNLTKSISDNNSSNATMSSSSTSCSSSSPNSSSTTNIAATITGTTDKHQIHTRHMPAMSASTGTVASTTVSKKNRRRHHHSSVYDDMDHASAECVRLNLDVARFACLFIPPDSPAVSAVSFAQNLTARLERHLEQTLVDADDEYFGSLSMLSSSKMSRCGLDHTKSHRHIHLLCDGHAAYKIRPSLYRTTRSRCPVLSISAMSANRHTTMQQQQRWSYFEVVVAVDSEFVISSSSSSFSRQDDDEQGRNPCGVCVGLSTKDLASDRLVGSDDYSVGLHCSGRIVRKGGTFYPACCKPFGVGDHIGCAVYADGSGDVGVAFFVNRVLVTRVTLPQQQEQKELFASISLYKPGVKVVLLCCKEDWDMKNDAVAEALGMQPSSYCSF